MFTPFHSRRRILAWAASLTAISMVQSTQAARNVQVDRVVRGTATFASSGSLTTITASNHAIINYKQFNIAYGETVRFVQPGTTSKVLNRINSNAPSLLDGSLLANGIVYFVNPAGVMFGPHSIVSVGGIIAAAGNITDNNFAGDVDHFSGSGAVINNGVINGSSVQLVGQTVANHGTINAPGGLVAMVAGQDVMLGTSSSNILVKIGTANSAGGVSNDGTINARGGSASLVSGDIYSMALGTPSVIKANHVSVEGGAVNVSGNIDASNSTGTGGTVAVTGQNVILTAANINASGSTGGGTVLIGGNFHGAGPLPNAQTTTISADSVIRADATTAGNGGSVAVWSQVTTTFAGTILARGAAGGSGGNAEVSSHSSLSFNPTKIDLGGGQLLLDPASITIVDNPADADINGDGTTGDDITGANDLSDANADYPGASSIISSTALNTVLSGSSVTLAATNFITDSAVTVPVHVGSGITLTLDAPTINLSGPINVDSGGTLAGGATVATANVHNGGLIQNGIDVLSASAAIYPIVNIDGGTYSEDVIVRQGNFLNPITFIAGGPITVNSWTVAFGHPAYMGGSYIAPIGFTFNDAVHAGLPSPTLGISQNLTLTGPITINNDGGTTSAGLIDSNDPNVTLITDHLVMSALAMIDNFNGTSGQGVLTIEPQTPSATIGIGDGTPPAATLQINPSQNIGGDFGLVVIGSAGDSGAITVGPSTFASPVTIQSPQAGGSITVNGQLTGAFINAGTLTLTAPTIAITANIIMPYQLGAVSINGATTLGTTSPISISTIYSPVTVAGAVTLGGDVIIDTTSGQNTFPASQGANIQLTSIAGDSHALTLNSGTGGTISVSGNVDAVSTLTITNSNGATFAGTVGATTPGNVTINNSQNGAAIIFDGNTNINTLATTGTIKSYILEFNEAAGGQTSTIQTASLANTSGLILGNNTADTVTFTNGLNYQVGTTEAIGAISPSQTSNIDLGPAVLTGATTFTGGTVTFHSTITGGQDLTVDGNAVFDDDVTLSSLHVTGNADLYITNLLIAGPLAFDGDLNLHGSGATAFTASSVTVGGTLNGDNQDLTINTTATLHAINSVGALQINGDATLDGDITVDSVTVTGASSIDAGEIVTDGDQNYDGAITLAGDSGFLGSPTSNITFHSTIDSGSSPSELDTDTGGTVTFVGDIGDTHPLRNLYTATGTNVIFGAGGLNSTIAISTVTTSPDGIIDFYTPITLAANTTITTRTIDFTTTLDSDSATTPRDLTITAAPGMLTFEGPFKAESLTASGASVIFSATGQTYALGHVVINASSSSPSSAIDLNAGTYNFTTASFTSPVTLTADTTINATGDVTFDSTIDSDSALTERALTINTLGTTTFDGEIGSTFLLASLTSSSNGTTVINTTYIGVAGDQTYNNPTTLGNDVMFQGSSVTFNNTVSGAHALDINGSVAFNAAPSVASILVTGDATINVPSITTTGSQNYQGTTTLIAGVDESFSGTGVTFAGLTGDGNDVTVTATTGTFGDVTDISQLQVNGNAVFDNTVGVNSLTVTGATTTFAGAISTSGPQLYDGPVTLEVDSSFIATDGGNITFASTIDSATTTPVSLFTETAGLTLFEGNIGATHPINNLQTAPFGTVQIGSGSGNLSITADASASSPDGEILFNFPVTLAANVTITGRQVIFSNSLDSDSGSTPRNLTINAAPGELVLDGPFNAESLTAGAANVSFASVGQTYELGNVIINQTTPSNAYSIDLNAGTYNYTNVTFTSPVILTDDTTIDATGDVDFQSTVDSDSTESERALTVIAGGVTTFAGNVGTIAPLASLSVGAITPGAPIITPNVASLVALSPPIGTTDLNAAMIDVAGPQNYYNPVSLSANVTLAESSNINFASIITGNGFNLTLESTAASFSGTVSGVGTFATNAHGQVDIYANISTTGSQTLGNVTIHSDVALAGVGISMASVTSSVPQAHDLTLNGDSGAITVGTVDDIALLTIQNSSATTFTGSFGASSTPEDIQITNTAGAVTFQGQTYISTITTTANPYSVAFTGSSTTIATDTTFNNTGGVTLGGNSNSVTLFAGSLTNTAGPTTAAGIVRTYSVPLTVAALTLSGDTTLDTTDNALYSTGAAITIASIAGGSHNLILTPGTSAITVTGNSDAIAQLTITNSGGATFGGTYGATTPGAVTIDDTAAGDTITFDGAANITTFTATATSNAYNLAFNAASGGQATVINTAQFANTGSITLGNDPADRITFTNGFSSTNPNLSISGTVAAVNNPITLGAVTVAYSATIAAGTGAISVSSATIDAGQTLTLGFGNTGALTLGTASGASSSSPSNLAFNTSGLVSVTGTIGPNIGALTVTNSGGATFSGAVTANTVTLTSTTGAIAFDNSLAASTLTDTAGSFDLQFLGATTITNAVTLGTTGTVTFGSGGTAMVFNGGVTHTTGPDILNGTLTSTNAPIDLDLQVTGNSTIDAGTAAITLGDTTLNAGVTLTLGTGNSGPVTVASIPGTATSALVINTTGAVNITGAVGSSTSPIDSVTIHSGPATFGDAITTAGDISITAADAGSGSSFVPGDLTFHGNLTAGGNITLQPGTTLIQIPGLTGAYSGSTITFYNNTITAGGNVSLISNADAIPGFGGQQASPAATAAAAVPANANIIAFGSPTTVNGVTGIALNIQAASFTMGPSANLLATTGGVNISVSSGTSTFSTIEALGSINITAASAATLNLVTRDTWTALDTKGNAVTETGAIFFAGGSGQPDVISTPDNFPTDGLNKYALSFGSTNADTGTAITLHTKQLLTASALQVTINGAQYYITAPIVTGHPTPPPFVEFFTAIPMVNQQLIQENIIFDSAMLKQFWRLGFFGRDITLDPIDGDGFRSVDPDQQLFSDAILNPPPMRP